MNTTKGRLLFIVCLIGLSILTSFTSPRDSVAISASRTLEEEVIDATLLMKGPQTTRIIVQEIRRVVDWSFGTVAIEAPSVEDAEPKAFVFIAQQKSDGWEVGLEGTEMFQNFVHNSPDELLSEQERSIFSSFINRPQQPLGNGSGLFSLPFATGETWTLTGGPHENNVAIDFAGGTGNIRAARDGVAYVPCANKILIYHANGWQTGYYHVANIAVTNGQSGITRGQFLGKTSAQVGCGGSATGAHVHFWTMINVTNQSIVGQDIGGWTVQAGTSSYQGCMTRLGVTQCAASGQIYNYGDIGSIEQPNQPPNTPNPIAPANGSRLNNPNITLTWQDTGDPDNKPRPSRDYYAQVWKSDNSWSQTRDWNVATSWNITVPNEGLYYWRVMSGDGEKASNWSANQSFIYSCHLFNIGEGSTRPQMFVNAFNRRGGRTTVGCTTNATHWWGDGGDRTVVIQNFTGGSFGDSVIIHDEKRDDPINSTPAYVVQWGIFQHYQSLGGWQSWLGPPTSDEFQNATGQALSNFANGYIAWNSGNPVAVAWPTSVVGQWRAEYHNGRNLNNYPTWVMNTPDINYEWMADAPGNGMWGVWADDFSVRWTGEFQFMAADYTFISTTDDGVRVWIDNQLVIDKWQDQTLSEYRVTRPMNAGNHQMKIEYYEGSAGATAKFRWEPNAPTIPNTPANFRVDSTNQNSVSLRWDDTSNESGYRIYRWNGESWPLIDTVGANQTSFVDKPLVCNEGYSYYVVAYNDLGQSNQSNWVDGFTTACPSNLPTYLDAVDIQSHRIRLGWDDNSTNELGYRIYREASNNWVAIGDIGTNGTSFTDTSVTCNTEYVYRLFMLTNSGEVSSLPMHRRITSAACSTNQENKVFIPFVQR